MNIFFWHQKDNASRTICICHDIERGMGHLVHDPSFAIAVDEEARQALPQMLAAEKEMRVRATYNILGAFLAEVRDEIAADGHCLAFHSYDHGRELTQLERCRSVDPTIKGYRPAQSILTPELNLENLRMHRFEWLASSASSLGAKEPQHENGILKIPIAFDDFPLYTHKMHYCEWERDALHRIKENRFVAFGLHDCYAAYWLPHYGEFLKKVQMLGTLKTMQDVADEEKSS